MLFAGLFAFAGCLQPADPASVSSEDDGLSSSLPAVSERDGVIEPPFCVAVVCNADRTCPVCNGQHVECDADNDCRYPRPAPSPPAPPVCPAATCNVDSDCAAACSRAPDPHCVSHACHYTTDGEDS